MNVLLVEDDAPSAQVASRILSYRGHRVRTVLCGAEALSAAQCDGYDAAIVDVNLPDLEGFAVVERLQRLQPGMRCVLVTGDFLPDGAERAGRLGALFRTKPIDYDELDGLLLSMR